MDFNNRKSTYIQKYAELIPEDVLEVLLNYEYSYSYLERDDCLDVLNDEFFDPYAEDLVSPYSESELEQFVEYYLNLCKILDEEYSDVIYGDYLQLSNEPIALSVTGDVDWDLYNDIANEYLDKFESDTGVKVFACGRSGKRICVDFTANNLRQYDDLVQECIRLQAEMVDYINGFSPIDEAYGRNYSDDVVNAMYDTLEEIGLMFQDAHLWAEPYGMKPYMNTFEVSFEIDGDWKHDHLYADKLVKDRYGKKLISTISVENGQSDSDDYSAIHTYEFRV